MRKQKEEGEKSEKEKKKTGYEKDETKRRQE